MRRKNVSYLVSCKKPNIMQKAKYQKDDLAVVETRRSRSAIGYFSSAGAALKVGLKVRAFIYFPRVVSTCMRRWASSLTGSYCFP